MSGLKPIHQTLNIFTDDLFSNCSFLEPYKSSICSNPLVERVTANWKVILMDSSTIIAVTCVVITFLTGSTVLCSAFAALALASAVSAFYMRKFATITDLEETALGLRVTKEKFEGLAKSLEQENNRLTESNRELQRNNETFRVSNQNLIQQVTQLTLQVTQLQESAQRIRSEVLLFQQQNAHLHVNVRSLDQQILNSRALCEQIGTQLGSHERGIGEQLEQLRRYLADLSADNRVHERIQQLATLQQQSQLAANQLHELQLQYAAERANFQAIHHALVQLREQFDIAIRDAAQHMQSNNQQFRDNVSALAAERQRIQHLLSRHFPTTHAV
ncbi:MAG: hypothetical protein JSS60_02040 [Verrucomicrobia bacterium]|nr:hypothetical protein [Verrucomicrobiota bacterium]